MDVLTTPTLYDDWQRRRRRLETLAGPMAAYGPGQARVLDYLLKRYAGSRAALHAARFPAPGEIFLDRRAIIVFHRLGAGKYSAVKTEQEATRRASVILKRLSNLNLQKSAESYAQTGAVADDSPREAARPVLLQPPTREQLAAWEKLKHEIAGRHEESHWPKLCMLINEALALGSQLPEQAVACLAARIAMPGAAEMLARCGNASAPAHVFQKWRECAAKGRMTPVFFIEVFSSHRHRAALADKLRLEMLTTERACIRVEAIRMLGRIGTLDDVSLLSDLLLLPPLENEAMNERMLMIRAMKAIARRDLLSFAPLSAMVDLAVHHIFPDMHTA